jgi:hypothetical protein
MLHSSKNTVQGKAEPQRNALLPFRKKQGNRRVGIEQRRKEAKSNINKGPPPTHACLPWRNDHPGLEPERSHHPVVVHFSKLTIILCYRWYRILTHISYKTSPTILAASLYVLSSFSHFSRSALMVSSSYRSSWNMSSLYSVETSLFCTTSFEWLTRRCMMAFGT